LITEGRKRIVLKYGTIVDVPSGQTDLIKELQKIARNELEKTVQV